MHRNFSTAVLLALLAACCPRAACAAPLLCTTTTDLGGGLFAYELSIDGQDGEFHSFFAQQFTFTGDLVGFPRWFDDTDPTASYLHAPWIGNSVGAPVQSPGFYSFSAGTGGGSQYLSLPLARVVVRGDLSVTGGIGRGGILYDLSGTFAASQSCATIESVHNVPDYLQSRTDPVPPPEPDAVLPAGPVDVPPEPETTPDASSTVELPLAPGPTQQPEVMPELPESEESPIADPQLPSVPLLDENPGTGPILNPDQPVEIVQRIGIPLPIWNPKEPLFIDAAIDTISQTIELPTTFDPGIRTHSDDHSRGSLVVSSSPDLVFYSTFNDLVTPEPATWLLALFGAAILAVAGGKWRRC